MKLKTKEVMSFPLPVLYVDSNSQTQSSQGKYRTVSSIDISISNYLEKRLILELLQLNFKF